MKNDLVSIIMLSRNKAPFLNESIESILEQTYQNWELLFLDDASNDNSIDRILAYSKNDHRFKISQCVYSRGETVNRNSSLSGAHGKWVAFLDAGDKWHPQKLERQIRFMEKNNYQMSYTSYGLIDEESKSRGVIIGGKEHITHKDMLKCCWPTYMTVMYNREIMGLLQVKKKNENNDYALWIEASKKADCYLLNDNLASYRIHSGIMDQYIMTNKFKWRYDCYREQEGLGVLVSFFYTLRNLCYGMWKWYKYVQKQ